MKRRLTILGIRGVPASHGGFETFAQELATFLIARGWDVFVYCQEEGDGEPFTSEWKGVKRIHIPVRSDGAWGTVVFDFLSIWHARNQPGLHLTLGYNTAVFNIVQRVWGLVNIMNMDGIEWKRQKWGPIARFWFLVNELAGCLVANHLIADHPKIKEHLASRVSKRKISMIPYGAHDIQTASLDAILQLGLEKNKYSVVIARPEPENSVLEIVRAFSAKMRGHKLVVLGNFFPAESDYHKSILASANDEIIFPGAIYDDQVVSALRFFARFYIHGHRVGGTNPSLVEALGAGCAVIAHDNGFNRWVAGESAFYFSDEGSLAEFFDDGLYNDGYQSKSKSLAKLQFKERFQWRNVLEQYEHLLLEKLHE